MLNSNKRSIELNTKTAEGKEVMEKLIREADILVENFHPGAIDHMGFTWEHIQEINPRLIFGSIKGFDECSPYVNVKAYENVAQAAGGAASTTGFWDGPPLVSAAALGDSNTGMHLLIGLLAALLHREKTGRGQRVTMSMQDAVLNLCRVKLRDQQRLDKLGYLEEYPQYPNGTFGDAVPRGGNAGGGGQPGWILKCKGWKPILTPIFISLFRSKTGKTPVKPSANQIGLPIRHTVQPMPDSHIFSIFLLKSKNTLSLLINMKRWPI